MLKIRKHLQKKTTSLKKWRDVFMDCNNQHKVVNSRQTHLQI